MRVSYNVLHKARDGCSKRSKFYLSLDSFSILVPRPQGTPPTTHPKKHIMKTSAFFLAFTAFLPMSMTAPVTGMDPVIRDVSLSVLCSLSLHVPFWTHHVRPPSDPRLTNLHCRPAHFKCVKYHVPTLCARSTSTATAKGAGTALPQRGVRARQRPTEARVDWRLHETMEFRGAFRLELRATKDN